MNVLPVITRELRAEARQAFTQAVLAVVLGMNLHARLVQRRFAMEGN